MTGFSQLKNCYIHTYTSVCEVLSNLVCDSLQLIVAEAAREVEDEGHPEVSPSHLMSFWSIHCFLFHSFVQLVLVVLFGMQFCSDVGYTLVGKIRKNSHLDLIGMRHARYIMEHSQFCGSIAS